MAQITITMAQAKPLVNDILRAGLVPMLSSSPGIGKSALGAEIAKDHNLFFVDERLASADPTDLNGFPMILNPGADRVKAGYVPMETFPIEGDPMVDKTRGWLLMLDEFNSAPLGVQTAAYKVILDKKVGKHKLHKNVAVIGAGNLATDMAIVNRLSTAMQSRLVHFQIVCCHEAWMLWADRVKIDHRVKSFINFKPELLHNFDPKHADVTFPCPRTWEFISKIIRPWADQIMKPKLPALTGTIGDGAGRTFFSYCQIFEQIPTFEEILADPKGVSFGEEPSMQYALSGMVGQRMEPKTADACIDFITRMSIDFQVATLRSSIARDPEVKKAENLRKWLAKNAEELL